MNTHRIFRICVVGITLFVGACGGESRARTAPVATPATPPAPAPAPVAVAEPSAPAADCDAPKPKPVAFAMCTE
jgi:hypothetical protein